MIRTPGRRLPELLLRFGLRTEPQLGQPSHMREEIRSGKPMKAANLLNKKEFSTKNGRAHRIQRRKKLLCVAFQ